jgi:spore photoproduct lyase
MDPLVESVERKSLVIRPSGRSTDFISPSFGHGCLYNCTYCYMKRHKPEGLTVADRKSVTDILTEINSHAWFDTTEKPNQTHEKFITYDISCNEDFALHAKYHDWQRIFKFFRDHDLAMGSFATKYVNPKLLEFNPEGKVRIRFSLMPIPYAKILEPNTSKIIDRIRAINDFIEAGYDVHINFSPVIVTDGWLEQYRILFEGVDAIVDRKHKHLVKAEVIFLTHNEEKHLYNVQHELPGEELLWRPDIQEKKISQYGGENLRYKSGYKADRIKEFLELKDEIIPWNTTRYAF